MGKENPRGFVLFLLASHFTHQLNKQACKPVLDILLFFFLSYVHDDPPFLLSKVLVATTLQKVQGINKKKTTLLNTPFYMFASTELPHFKCHNGT